MGRKQLMSPGFRLLATFDLTSTAIYLSEEAWNPSSGMLVSSQRVVVPILSMVCTALGLPSLSTTFTHQIQRWLDI